MNLPVTRYYGSKRKLVEKIWNILEETELPFNSVLDVFGGTGIFSYYARTKGKEVIYNDLFKFNFHIARALMGCPQGMFTVEESLGLLNRNNDIPYRNVIEENYRGIYYPDEENRQIDTIVQNISRLNEELKSPAFYVLLQSCLIKRPFNLFHRKNLNLRTNHTFSKFGNKVTWEKTFEELFRTFTEELNRFQFQRVEHVSFSNESALNCYEFADLVYIDPPYFSQNGAHTSYHSRYHFLEGLVNYEQIEESISLEKNNKEILINKSTEFENRNTFKTELEQLIRFHEHSIIAISYTNGGYPTIEELEDWMVQIRGRNHVQVVSLGRYSYALNRSNPGKEEYLIIAS